MASLWDKYDITELRESGETCSFSSGPNDLASTDLVRSSFYMTENGRHSVFNSINFVSTQGLYHSPNPTNYTITQELATRPLSGFTLLYGSHTDDMIPLYFRAEGSSIVGVPENIDNDIRELLAVVPSRNGDGSNLVAQYGRNSGTSPRNVRTTSIPGLPSGAIIVAGQIFPSQNRMALIYERSITHTPTNTTSLNGVTTRSIAVYEIEESNVVNPVRVSGSRLIATRTLTSMTFTETTSGNSNMYHSANISPDGRWIAIYRTFAEPVSASIGTPLNQVNSINDELLVIPMSIPWDIRSLETGKNRSFNNREGVEYRQYPIPSHSGYKALSVQWAHDASQIYLSREVYGNTIVESFGIKEDIISTVEDTEVPDVEVPDVEVPDAEVPPVPTVEVPDVEVPPVPDAEVSEAPGVEADTLTTYYSSTGGTLEEEPPYDYDIQNPILLETSGNPASFTDRFSNGIVVSDDGILTCVPETNQEGVGTVRGCVVYINTNPHFITSTSGGDFGIRLSEVALPTHIKFIEFKDTEEGTFITFELCHFPRNNRRLATLDKYEANILIFYGLGGRLSLLSRREIDLSSDISPRYIPSNSKYFRESNKLFIGAMNVSDIGSAAPSRSANGNQRETALYVFDINPEFTSANLSYSITESGPRTDDSPFGFIHSQYTDNVILTDYQNAHLRFGMSPDGKRFLAAVVPDGIFDTKPEPQVLEYILSTPYDVRSAELDPLTVGETDVSTASGTGIAAEYGIVDFNYSKKTGLIYVCYSPVGVPRSNHIYQTLLRKSPVPAVESPELDVATSIVAVIPNNDGASFTVTVTNPNTYGVDVSVFVEVGDIQEEAGTSLGSGGKSETENRFIPSSNVSIPESTQEFTLSVDNLDALTTYIARASATITRRYK